MIQDPTCVCGQEEQMMDHNLFQCPLCPRYKNCDLRNAAEGALAWLIHWCENI